MGFSTRNNGRITDFTPDDTAEYFYINSDFSPSLSNILERAQEKWPGITLEEVEIDAEYIHTLCLGYDRYDPSDYTNYLKISASQEYLERKNKQ